MNVKSGVYSGQKYTCTLGMKFVSAFAIWNMDTVVSAYVIGLPIQYMVVRKQEAC